MFGVTEGGVTFHGAWYVLRRIEEAPEGWLGQSPRCIPTFAVAAVPEKGVLPGPGTDVVLDFGVPETAGGTNLSAPYPSYWELQVTGDTSGGEFDERFLIPIYERTARTAEQAAA
jgi:hypothetical protein